ncbi:MAG: adenylyltransferase/cytidyltransferase family protein [bacterium]
MFYTIDSITPICAQLHTAGRKLVLATGFFDLFHAEHINFLRKAKAVGDILIVAVESDERAKLLKGEGRPVDAQLKRCQNVSQYADYIVALGADFNNFDAYDSLMSAIRPQIYAVSSNTSHPKSKDFLAEKYGGHLEIVHDWNPSISTTQIINSKNNI